MNDTMLAKYRAKLGQLRADLARENALGAASRQTVTLDQQSVGRLSRMDALQQQAMAQATQARRDQMAQRIGAALARIDQGDFGACMECGEDIAPKRLDLDPTILTCIACARA